MGKERVRRVGERWEWEGRELTGGGRVCVCMCEVGVGVADTQHEVLWVWDAHTHTHQPPLPAPPTQGKHFLRAPKGAPPSPLTALRVPTQITQTLLPPFSLLPYP